MNAGASAIGFVFYPKSPRYIQPERAAEIGDGLKVWKVGIFVEETAKRTEQVAQRAGLDVVQLYGGFQTVCEDSHYRVEIPTGFRIWQAKRILKRNHRPHQQHHHRIDIERLSQNAEAVLLDSQQNGSSFDWTIARDSKRKVIVAGGLDASNVAEAIRIARPWGVDASSKLEIAPGVKDHEKVKAFVAAALSAAKEFAVHA